MVTKIDMIKVRAACELISNFLNEQKVEKDIGTVAMKILVKAVEESEGATYTTFENLTKGQTPS